MKTKTKVFFVLLGSFSVLGCVIGARFGQGTLSSPLAMEECSSHNGNHYKAHGGLDSETNPETFGYGIQEYYICCKCQKMFLAKDGVPNGTWTPIQDLREDVAAEIGEKDYRATKLNVADFLNLDVGTIKISSIDGFDHQVAKVEGFGKIGFNGAYFASDTFLTKYSTISFEVKFDGEYSNNKISTTGGDVSFTTDGKENSLNNDLVRIYKDTIQTTVINKDTWYTISIKVDDTSSPSKINPLSSIYMELGETSHSLTLQSLRFGTDWDNGFQADELGISAGSGLKEISRKTIGGKDLIAVYGNGSIYFDDVRSEAGIPGQYFLSNYKYVSFDIYATYHDAPQAFVPYGDFWMHPTADWSWAGSHPDGLFVKSYQNGVEVDKFNLDQWYTFNFEVANNPSYDVRFQLGATFAYITNVKFSTEPIVGEAKTDNDKPGYDSLGFALNKSTATMQKVIEDGKECVEIITTEPTELYFEDIGVKQKLTDGSTKGIGGAYHSGYGHFSVDVKVMSGNNFYWVIPWQDCWHNATGAANAIDADYLKFSDLYGNQVTSIMWYENWYRMTVKINNAQGNDWCMTWALNEETGTHLFITNLQFIA